MKTKTTSDDVDSFVITNQTRTAPIGQLNKNYNDCKQFTELVNIRPIQCHPSHRLIAQCDSIHRRMNILLLRSFFFDS